MKKIILQGFLVLMAISVVYANFNVSLKKNKLQNVDLIILCYHHLDLKKSTPYSISTIEFVRQLNALEKAGFKFISLQQVEDYYYRNKPIPEKSAVVTFDDGNVSVYRAAYPILEAKQIPLAIFIYPSIINQGHRRGAMNWNELRELAANGVTVGDHSYCHPRLDRPPLNVFTTANYNAWLDYQLQGSKQLIELRLGRPVKYFAAPYGVVNKTILKKIRENDYLLAFNTYDINSDQNANPLNLNRTIILSNITPESLVKKAQLKPLPLDVIYPENAGLINKGQLLVKFKLKEPEKINKNSLVLELSRGGEYKVSYNPVENCYQQKISIPASGVYQLKVLAKDNFQRKYQGGWQFTYKKRGWLF